ncbi:hypothetical protein OY671_009866 [Metschnikowia pulcherrima]|nr:hypothetical protein OY671_009866 [Metschnikowia pulcherrima]
MKEDVTMNSQIKENMEVIGADGVHVGTVDRVEGDRIKLKKSDSFGAHEGHHQYIETGFVGPALRATRSASRRTRILP